LWGGIFQELFRRRPKYRREWQGTIREKEIDMLWI
jgi:hypothetical protein